MTLSRLQVQAVRNLREVDISLGVGGNIFVGENGAGKTSLLEAVHLLGLGRSFRSGSFKPLIHHEADSCWVAAQVSRGASAFPLGIQRHRSGEVVARRAGAPIQSLVELAQSLPIVVLETEGLSLITGPPELRRRFLDATVFHVEQAFISSWRAYQRALKQRNAALRRGTMGAEDVWAQPLVEAGEAVTASRERLLSAIQDRFLSVVADLSPALSGVELSLRQGWEHGLGLADALCKQRESDRQQGFTQSGPHRADVRVVINGRPAAEVLSRGQLKVVTAALRLAQGGVMFQALKEPPVFLVDDLTAELDAEHAERVCAALQAVGAQVLMTTVHAEGLRDCWAAAKPQVFHVEQGAVRQIG